MDDARSDWQTGAPLPPRGPGRGWARRALHAADVGLAALGRFAQSRFGTHLLAIFAGLLLARSLGLSGGAPTTRTDASATDRRTAKSGSEAGTPRESAEFRIPPYAAFLRDVKIVIDPGHGGDANRGPNYKRAHGVREAEVNLRVALRLRDLLEAAGARVWLTRETDIALGPNDGADLAARASLANRVHADLFLSIHHNYVDRPEPNYSLVFYHESADDSRAAVSAARYLVTGLNDALNLEQHVDSALRTDHTIYDEGFRVLRLARVPAVLTEASFYSNPDEARRLADPEYNDREAEGLFLGLARWAQAGLPRIRSAALQTDGPEPLIRVRVYDGLSDRGNGGPRADLIRWSSLDVRVNDHPAATSIDDRKDEILVRIPSAVAPPFDLYVDFQNVFGQHVLHPRLRVE